ncbi:flagellar motor switch phosphatase FliY [Clostridium hydrogeniformans]|uniref:flagellar motor switch phosphatase FliY n=1 Tax=Clostridium hydrogeniformans TaxID=349933 RepID=UPI00047F13F0|nr:flagellar motor switch phosphatase FliY [Clostridium hydrogeniformans]
MSNGFLSQEEIDSLLNGGAEEAQEDKGREEDSILSDIEKDLLGEIGNISMGSASTALSQIINQQVNITTPMVSVTSLDELKKSFEVPNIALEVEYTTGIVGLNLLVMKTSDASVIANLMMGGDGTVQNIELSEIEISAVSEAMNQMIGSAATSMATMFSREVNISPPTSKVWADISDKLSEKIDEEEKVVKVSFKLTIGDLIDSNIMQILPVNTAKKIVSIMMGQDTNEIVHNNDHKVEAREERVVMENFEKPIELEPKVQVHQAEFQTLKPSSSTSHQNIDLILDVPLEISVVLGRTKKNIKDILNLGTGSLIELDKLAEEPVEILVNGKRIAYGEVVVVDENFGVRITSIISSSERVKSLGK